MIKGNLKSTINTNRNPKLTKNIGTKSNINISSTSANKKKDNPKQNLELKTKNDRYDKLFVNSNIYQLNIMTPNFLKKEKNEEINEKENNIKQVIVPRDNIREILKGKHRKNISEVSLNINNDSLNNEKREFSEKRIQEKPEKMMVLIYLLI
jgi:hypothetical protein